MPGSMTASGATHTRCNAPVAVAFRATQTSATQGEILSQLNGWPMHTSADASHSSLRTNTHGLRSVWLATPSS